MARHELVNVIVTRFGLGGVCSCGKWGGTAKNKRQLKQAHREHKISAGS